MQKEQHNIENGRIMSNFLCRAAEPRRQPKRRSIRLELGEASGKQSEFYGGRAAYNCYGGARGGGKTHALRTKAIGGALLWPGIRILLVRRTYPELQGNHIEPILRLINSEIAEYTHSRHILTFVNGSTIRFGHFQNVTSESEYQGQEYDWILIDEATQFTEREFRILAACLRGASKLPRRMYLSCNPGGVGHSWVKRLFIDRRYHEGENGSDYSFVFASVEDNKYLLEGTPDYVRSLELLPEDLRRAHRFGDWNALSGQYFKEFRPEIHLVAPFRIPAHWARCRAFDYGLDMLACLWVAVDELGQCYVYRELHRPGLVASEAAERILALSAGERDCITIAPPDMWSRQKDTGRSIAEVFAENGLPLLRASNAREQGHLQLKELLRVGENGPRLRIFDSCQTLISDITAIQADPMNPNDCAKTPHDCTHSVDALRYFAITRSLPAQLPEPELEAEEGSDYGEFMRGGAVGNGYIY